MPRAVGLAGAAAPAADATAAMRHGLAYLLGTGQPADPSRGLALIEQAASDGDPHAAFVAAAIAASSFWRAPDWDRAWGYLVQAAELGHQAARSSLQILAGGPEGEPAAGDDWASLCGRIDLPAWFVPPETKLVRATPRIQVIDRFAPPAVCDWLIDQARGRLSRATIYDKATGGATEDSRRTNTQCDLDIENCGVLTFVLRGRIGALTHRQDQAMEIPKVLHYSPGETFHMHYDYLDPAQPAYASELALRGQRTDTFLIYLNDDFSGGETTFPEIGFSHAGVTGGALLFSNVDDAGEPDPKTMHAGLPPSRGEKWVFSQWIRAFPKH